MARLDGLDKFAIGGLVTGKRWATGATLEISGVLTVTGLTFTPSILIIKSKYNSSDYVIKVPSPSVALYMYFYNGYSTDMGDPTITFNSGGFVASVQNSSGYGHDWLAIE